MPIVSVRHLTAYRYRNSVAFGEHRLMLRPLEGFDQRLVAYDLAISPEPSELRQFHDPGGACVGVAAFRTRSDRLSFESRFTVDHTPQAPCDVAGSGGGDFTYDEDEAGELAMWIARRQGDAGEVEDWARRFLSRGRRSGPVEVLRAMTEAIRADLIYQVRPLGPAQPPAQTLERGLGSCRDFAFLLVEAARGLGLAARFVSGYIYAGSAKASRASKGHTHAWAQVYLPGRGWTDFDPTNGIIGNAGLIRVAAATHPRTALPLCGSWRGLASDFVGMDVEVEIVVDEQRQAAAPSRRAKRA